MKNLLRFIAALVCASVIHAQVPKVESAVSITGTAGNGYVSYNTTQSAAPATPAAGFVEYADSSGQMAWRRASDTFVRTFASVLTANRTYTWPDATITIAGSASALTSGRVPFVTTGGLLLDASTMTFSSGTLTLGGNLVFGTSGSTLNGTTGSIGLTATGTNQSITLTPSGTGLLKTVCATQTVTLGESGNVPYLWLLPSATTPTTSNFQVATFNNDLYLNAVTSGGNVYIQQGNSTRLTLAGTTGNATFVGSVATSQTGGIIGTTTNNNANAGSVGEVISSVITSGSLVTLTTGTTANITSVSLTAGDWDVTGAVDFQFGAATSYTNLVGGISATSATIGAQDAAFDFETAAAVPTAGADMTWVVPTVRVSIASTTTYYLIAQGTFTVSTLKTYGTIRARRIR